ncbi:MAG: hypothetical protein WCP06_03380 [Verrucomicrobiota bacterium]
MKPKKSDNPAAKAKRSAKRNARKIKAERSTETLRTINKEAGGIDVGAEEHYHRGQLFIGVNSSGSTLES